MLTAVPKPGTVNLDTQLSTLDKQIEIFPLSVSLTDAYRPYYDFVQSMRSEVRARIENMAAALTTQKTVSLGATEDLLPHFDRTTLERRLLQQVFKSPEIAAQISLIREPYRTARLAFLQSKEGTDFMHLIEERKKTARAIAMRDHLTMINIKNVAAPHADMEQAAVSALEAKLQKCFMVTAKGNR